MSEQILDRAEAISKNMDPQGRTWRMKYVRGEAMLMAVPEPYRKDFQCPELMSGRWTRKTDLEEKINLYLERAWDAADLATVKKTRKTQAKKETKNARTKDTEELLPPQSGT